MIRYNGLGHEDLEFDEAVELIKENIYDLDEYIMDLLFDILMEEQEVDYDNQPIYNRA